MLNVKVKVYNIRVIILKYRKLKNSKFKIRSFNVIMFSAINRYLNGNALMEYKSVAQFTDR